MGCDIHMVLQQKQEDGTWKTVLKDLMWGRDYELFGFLSGVRGAGWDRDNPIATEGLPEDFSVTKQDVKDTEDAWGEGTLDMHEGQWMGEHSFGHVTLKDFCEAKSDPEPKMSDHMTVEKFDFAGGTAGYTVTFLADGDLDDPQYNVRMLQRAFKLLFYDLENYRLVFGYDS